MNFVVGRNAPTQKEFLLNMEEKMQDTDFLGDISGLLRREQNNNYDAQKAYETIKSQLIEKL